MAPWYSLFWFKTALWQQYQFANAPVLYLIPFGLILFVLRYYLHQNAEQRLNLSLDLLGGGPSRPSSVQLTRSLLSSLRYALPISVFVAFSLLLVALARPQLVRELREEQSEGIDIMLALDVSESMTETDLLPNRLSAARRVAQSFVNGRKNDRIGLVIFAGEAFSLCPLTTDYDLVKQYLNQLNDRMIRTSGTAIGDALARCINRMRVSEAATTDTTVLTTARSRVVILISDGDNTAGNLDPLTAARLAKAFDIKLYTIAVGRPARSGTTVTTVDEGVLKTIAQIGRGSFFRATDANRLRTVFGQIDRLERTPIRVRVYEDVQDYYRIYVYWAIAFLLFALLLKSTIFGNVLED